jgi:hypothetical protein
MEVQRPSPDLIHRSPADPRQSPAAGTLPESSPLKRKMASSAQTDVTAIGSEAKRRRHHRRKANKNRRPKLEFKPNVPPQKNGQKKCQKMSRKQQAGNQHLLWRRKKKHPTHFYQQHFNSDPAAAAATTAAAGQKGQAARLAAGNGCAGKRRGNVVLRPTKVPLLNAPRNSTQFIIDDHESSDLIWNFEAKVPVPRKSQSQATTETEDRCVGLYL